MEGGFPVQQQREDSTYSFADGSTVNGDHEDESLHDRALKALPIRSLTEIDDDADKGSQDGDDDGDGDSEEDDDEDEEVRRSIAQALGGGQRVC